MEFVVVILVIALIAAVAYIVMQRRPGGAGWFGRSRTGPVVRRPRGGEEHPMANAVVDHIEATGPQEVAAAEQRLRAQARQVAAPIQAEHDRREQQRVADQVRGPDAHAAPQTHAQPDPYADPSPAADPYADRPTAAPAHPADDRATDPRYNHKPVAGRPAADNVDPRDGSRR